jgi:hypothetical protein
MKISLLGFAVVLASLCFASAVTAQVPARGYIDCRWNAGYVVRNRGHNECGRFVVCPGCSCLTPTQYRSFAGSVLPGVTAANVGFSWYAAGHALSTDSPGFATDQAVPEILPPRNPTDQ